MKPKEKSNSIAKALKILSAFVPNNEEMGTVEISQKLGFHSHRCGPGGRSDPTNQWVR
jgi:hypothetical protein